MSELTTQKRPEDDSQKSSECIFPIFEPMHTYTAPAFDGVAGSEEGRTWNPVPLKNFRPRNVGSGMLELLPLELFHEITELLDFDTIGNLRLTCYGTRLRVDSAPISIIFRKHAWNTLGALKRIGALGFHPSWDLQSTLLEDRCVCGDYGPYFFAFTGHRRGLNAASVLRPGKNGPERHQWYSIMQVKKRSQRVYPDYWLSSHPNENWAIINHFHVDGKEASESKLALAVPMPYLPSFTATHAEHGLYCKYCIPCEDPMPEIREVLLEFFRGVRPQYHYATFVHVHIGHFGKIYRRKALSRAEWYEHLSQGCLEED
ncbi:hypothetical protein ACMFMG_006906 [Clarireedia jacksonii]